MICLVNAILISSMHCSRRRKMLEIMGYTVFWLVEYISIKNSTSQLSNLEYTIPHWNLVLTYFKHFPFAALLMIPFKYLRYGMVSMIGYKPYNPITVLAIIYLELTHFSLQAFNYSVTLITCQAIIYLKIISFINGGKRQGSASQ